jgi:hypothetical protein
MNITWSGTIETGAPIQGTCSVTIDENGDITGSFEGAYSGTIAGQVDLIGNLIAVGTLSNGMIQFTSTWAASVTLTGKTLGVDGKWNSTQAWGIFSGTGTVSY